MEHWSTLGTCWYEGKQNIVPCTEGFLLVHSVSIFYPTPRVVSFYSSHRVIFFSSFSFVIVL